MWGGAVIRTLGVRRFPFLTGRVLPKPPLQASDKGQVRQAEGTEYHAQSTPEAGPDTDTPRAWDDSPLRVKITVLAMLGVMGGVGIGMIESHTGHTIWPLLVGLMMVGVALSVLARVWIWQPIEHLIEDVRHVGMSLRPAAARKLPAGRRDELGQIARTMQRLVERAARDHREALHLRRTLDHRVSEATRRATKRLRIIAMRDPLTNMGNRRFLDEQLPMLVESCRASRTDLICVMLDLDRFKAVNDTLGHAAGDDLLSFVAGLIRASVRREDLTARLGGDEFAIFMPDADMVRARHFVRQLRVLFRQHVRASLPKYLSPDVTAGYASLTADDLQTAEQLLQAADVNLYAAKQSSPRALERV